MNSILYECKLFDDVVKVNYLVFINYQCPEFNSISILNENLYEKLFAIV